MKIKRKVILGLNYIFLLGFLIFFLDEVNPKEFNVRLWICIPFLLGYFVTQLLEWKRLMKIQKRSKKEENKKVSKEMGMVIVACLIVTYILSLLFTGALTTFTVTLLLLFVSILIVFKGILFEQELLNDFK